MNTPAGGLHALLGRRRAGVLLHPTSLPHAPGEGALGPHAYHFVDFLCSAGQQLWQVLPLHPPHVDRSPYNACSAFAGDPALVSAELAADWGWVAVAPAAEELLTAPAQWQTELGDAFGRCAHDEDLQRYESFCSENAYWLDDYALYAALRAERAQPWTEWPDSLRDRAPAALAEARRRHADEMRRHRVLQFAFFRQWQALRDYATDRGVSLFGDIPIFVAPDSADVWAHRELFKLDAAGVPAAVAGCPPDYYSATGQHWGNPLYDWTRMQADGYRWWADRLALQLQMFDLVRIDHFRGFDAYWEIPAGAATAAEGRWVPGPGERFFDAMRAALRGLPIIAEDLGVITDSVHGLRDRYGFPGMRVLQFGFDGNPNNPHLTHEHVANAVVYTGTHDNDTTLGWYRSLPTNLQERVKEYFNCGDADMPWALIRAALASPCRLAVVPMQDILGLDSRHRMNTPGTTVGNWTWRFDWAALTPDIVERLRQLTGLYGRG
jgi:4-alpha-glucanotransferase